MEYNLGNVRSMRRKSLFSYFKDAAVVIAGLAIIGVGFLSAAAVVLAPIAFMVLVIALIIHIL